MKRVALTVCLVVLPLLALGVVVWRRGHTGTSDALAEARAKVGTRSATPLLEQLRRERPGNPEVFFLSARQARLAGMTDEAAAYLSQAESFGWSREQLERERLLGLSRTSFPQVRPALEELLATTPDSIEVLLELGEGELQSGRTDQAVELANRVLGQSPGNDRALHLRGSARLRARKLDLARADLENAAADPDSLIHARARLSLATCLLDLGEFSRALELFRTARDDEPMNPLAHFGVGRAAGFSGRSSEAEEAFSRVLALRPGHVETLVSLAQVVEERGDLERALAYLEEAEKGEPNRLETHARLAKLLTAMGRHEQAARHQARFQALDPTAKPPAPPVQPAK